MNQFVAMMRQHALAWQSRVLRRRTARIARRLSTAAGWYCLFHGLACAALLPGCAWVRAQAQHRRDECRKLCSQADEAQESGHVHQADLLLDEALRKSPKDLEVQRQLAQSLWEVGRQRDALELMTRLAKEHPQDVRLAIALAGWFADLERYDEALEWLRPGLSADPPVAQALELKAQIETAQGNDDAALMTYQRLGRQEAFEAQALVRMGEIYLQRGQPERAAPLFRSALAHPRSAPAQKILAQWDLGVAYAQLERWSDAATHLAQSAPEREMDADDWHALAYAHFRSGDLLAAQDATQHALVLEPRHPAGQKLAGLLRESGLRRHASSDGLLPAGFERLPSPRKRPVR